MLRLVVLNQLLGEVVPCRCYTPMLGGIDRAVPTIQGLLRSVTDTERRDRAVFLATGNVFSPYPTNESAEDDDAQWMERSALISRALLRVPLEAHLRGDLDYGGARSPTAARAETRSVDDLAVDSNPAVAGPSGAGATSRSIRIDGARINVFSVVWSPAASSTNRRSPWAPLRDAVRAAGPSDLSIIHIHGVGLGGSDVRDVQIPSLAALYLVSGALSSHVREALVRAIEQRGTEQMPCVALSLESAKGSHVDFIDIYMGPSPHAVVNGSRLPLELEIVRHVEQRRKNRERDGGGDSGSVGDRARRRIDELAARGAVVVHYRTPVDASLSRDTAVAGDLEKYGEWLTRAYDTVGASTVDFSAWARPYVGGGQCGNCHPAQAQAWEADPHARAWRTLEQAGRAFDYACFKCHSTGYMGEPRLRDVRALAGLRNVQCEACHGPGDRHTLRPSRANISKDVPRGVCLRCHDVAHSPGFNFEEYRLQCGCLRLGK